MSLKVAIQMDPVESIDIEWDSTFALMLEAQKRGHRLFYYQPHELALENNRLYANASAIQIRPEKGNHYSCEPKQKLDLNTIDIVLMRQDPPFNMAYITATYLLEHIHKNTLIVNDPVAVRNAPEKLLVTHFPDLIPKTLISADRESIRAFCMKHKDVVLKPLYLFGGKNIQRVQETDSNLDCVLDMYEKVFHEPIVAQKFIPEVAQGDKRIILIDGKPEATFSRLPSEGSFLANMASGGKAEKTTLTNRDLEICSVIGPQLANQGLIFASIDIIGPYLTEINVTSPGGLKYIKNLYGESLEVKMWDVFEEKLKNLRNVKV